MFKKNYRLTTSEFSEHFTNGKKFHSDHLTIIYKEGVDTKVAVVVGKKVAKSAVLRNTIKRRIYASLRKYQLEKNVSFGKLIVIVKKSYNTLSRKEAEEILLKTIKQVIK